MEGHITEIINKDEYRQKFGMVMRALRIRNRFTLRGLGGLINLSHAHLRKIEMAQTSINEKVFDRLMNVYHFNLEYDAKIESEFEYYCEQFHDSILQLNNNNMRKYYHLIQQKADVHKRSLWMVDYQIVELAYQCQTLDRFVDNLTILYDELNALEPLINPSSKPLYYIYMANYYYHIGLPKKSAASVQKIFDLNTWDKYTAMANYLIGMAYAKTFSLQKSNKHFNLSLKMFQNLNYTIQEKAVLVFIAINNIRMKYFNDIETIFNEGISLSKHYGLYDLIEYIHLHYAVYYFKKNAPLNALEQLDKSTIKTEQWFFYKAYAHYINNDIDTMNQTIESSFYADKEQRKTDLLYHYALKALLTPKMANTQSANAILKNFFEACQEQSMFFEIDIAYELYKSFLIEQRQYKKAFSLTKTMVQIAKNAFE